MTANMLAAIAQFDNDAKAERTKAGMKAAVELGRWPFQAPLGYLNGRADSRGLLSLDPERAPLVRQAFELFSTGQFTKKDVLRQVTTLGLRTSAGKPVAAQTFNDLLRNPIYAGWIKVPSWNLEARADFQSIVSEAQFRRVQRLMDGHVSPVTPHVRNHPDFPLRRFVTCAGCGAPLTGSWSRGRARSYAYYHCPRCRAVKAPKQLLEERFVRLLGCLQPEPAYVQLLNAVVLDVWRKQQRDLHTTRRTLEGRLESLRQRLDRVEEAFLYERRIDARSYEAQRDKLREEIALLELELSEARTDQFDVEGILAFANHVLTNAARLWLELDLDAKQRLQRVLFPAGVSFDGQEFRTDVTCFAFKRLADDGATNSGMASPGGSPCVWKPLDRWIAA